MSDHWLQKMRTYFKRIDFDHDGAITRRDFEGMAQRFTEKGKLNEAKSKDLTTTLTSVWDKYLSAVGGGDAIKEDAFVDGMKKLVKDPSLKATLEGPLPLFFHAVDGNDDGKIDQEEFTKFFEILGLDTKFAPDTFKAIDTDGDGILSTQEFQAAGSEFFLSDDASKPTRLFWGPLV